MQRIRRRFILLLSIFLALDVALVAYLVWPGSNPSISKIIEAQLREEEKHKAREVEPLRNIDKQLPEKRAEIKKFYSERVPTRWSQISSELNKLAQQNGVSVGSIEYKPEDAAVPNVQQIGIDTGIAGDYLKIAHFINALERDKLLFVIKQVSVRAEQGGIVQLHISFETFLKEA